MDASPRISTAPPELKSQDFQFLRAEGLSVIQALAAKTWTDHNLHDPGITLLEAICYALTEAGLRAGMDLRDLLASSSAIRPSELFTAPEVLPVAPVTPTDLRKVLIDHPLVNNAWIFPLLPVPLGRLSVLVEFADDTLNNNVVIEEITVGPDTYRVALAFPHWDDEDVAPFREDVTLQSVVFPGPPGSEWNPIEGSTSFFTRCTVTYQPPAGAPQAQDLWVVVQIVTEMDDPGTEAPLVLQQVTTLVAGIGDNGPLKNLNRLVMRAFETVRVVRRYALPYRNLCEDMAEFNAVRVQEVAVSAIVEIGSAEGIEELLTEIFYRIDQLVAPVIPFARYADALQQAASADAVLDGPLTDSGLLNGSDLGSQIEHTIYTSDILRLIYQLRSEGTGDVTQREDVTLRRIVSVRSLSLSNYIDNRAITTRARDCLQLVKSSRHIPRLSVVKSRIVIYRNGIEVAYDARRVLELFEEGKAAEAQQQTPEVVEVPVPAGETYPIGDYYPIQNDLPVVYGVGEAGLPEHAPVLRRAQARQLKGYLFPIEQMVAGYHAQLAQFNTFFSAGAGIGQTLFQQPLYHLPNVAPLFKSFDPQSVTWEEFQQDDMNPYARVLREAVESPEQFLDRRNAVLDHLLANLGEDMRERTALLLRLAAQVPGDTTMSLPALLEAKRQRRLLALRELIRDKSAYYYDVPSLNRDRGQAFGHPLWRRPGVFTTTAAAGGFEWRIADGSDVPVFRQFAPAASSIEARRTAEQVLKLATTANRYTLRTLAGSERILQIRSSATADPLAESIDIYPNEPAALAAIPVVVNAMLALWTTYALIPLETRLYHMLGIDVRERRRLVQNTADYIEIFDDVPNPNNEKRFRFWGSPGFAGDQLLESTGNYAGLTPAAATQAALAAASLAIDQGVDPANYTVVSPSPTTFRVVLLDAGGNPLARSVDLLASLTEGQTEAEFIRMYLYRLFSAEGCYLIEHHLLFPPAPADTSLVIPGNSEPYSLQVTAVLPSGFARDFSQAGSVPEPARPPLYRNTEFRKYAEAQIRRFCPAQVLPRVLWIDRSVPNTPVGDGDASLDAFEQAYFNWLLLYLSDEPDSTALGTARNALTTVLNALYQEYFLT